MSDGLLQPGDVIDDRYTVTKSLETGNLTTAYVVSDGLEDRDMVLKVVASLALDSASRLDEFRSALAGVFKLRHRNIAQVQAIGTFGESCFYTMEYFRWGSLGNLLNQLRKAEKQMGLEACLGISTQVCDALIHAHETMVHNTLNLRNILLEPAKKLDGNSVGGMYVGVSDFEVMPLIKIGDITQARPKDDRGRYMAPEVKPGRRGSPRADIFSIGVLMYEMLTAELPDMANYESPHHLRDGIPTIL